MFLSDLNVPRFSSSSVFLGKASCFLDVQIIYTMFNLSFWIKLPLVLHLKNIRSWQQHSCFLQWVTSLLGNLLCNHMDGNQPNIGCPPLGNDIWAAVAFILQQLRASYPSRFSAALTMVILFLAEFIKCTTVFSIIQVFKKTSFCVTVDSGPHPH